MCPEVEVDKSSVVRIQGPPRLQWAFKQIQRRVRIAFLFLPSRIQAAAGHLLNGLVHEPTSQHPEFGW